MLKECPYVFEDINVQNEHKIHQHAVKFYEYDDRYPTLYDIINNSYGEYDERDTAFQEAINNSYGESGVIGHYIAKLQDGFVAFPISRDDEGGEVIHRPLKLTKEYATYLIKAMESVQLTYEKLSYVYNELIETKNKTE